MDVYFKKEITYSFAGEKFKFDVGETLFSTFDIDHGTDVLLRAVNAGNPKTIIDLGCGYGSIGIILAKKYPQAKVTLIDRDLLAIRFTKINIEKNNIQNVEVFGSVGMKQIKNKNFDLIVSNIPAKIGDNAITEEFILTPVKHLNLNGEYWFVVVNALNHLIPSVGRKYQLNIKEIKKRNGHTVYVTKKPA